MDTWTYLTSPAEEPAPKPYTYTDGAYVETLDEARREYVGYGTLPTERDGRAITDAEIAAIVCVSCARCTCNAAPLRAECPECGHRNTPGETRHDEGTVS
jgi:hypothetical protein